MLNNDERALLGVAAMEAAKEQVEAIVGEHDLGVRVEDLVITTMQDTMAWLLHACDRYGLDGPAMVADAQRRYEHNIERGPRARQIADGEEVSLRESSTNHHIEGASCP